MKILITGAGGQIARAVISTAPSKLDIAALDHEQLNISDKDAVKAHVIEMAPDVIINAAAFTAVDLAESESDQARLVNESGPSYLAEAAAQGGARLVHISTDFVFDGLASKPYAPDSITNPLSVYGRTKRAGEIAVASVLPKQSIILRTAWVYAAQGRNFVRSMLRLMNERDEIRVVADQIGTPTAATSVAAIIWALINQTDLYGIWHWTDAGTASWYDLAVAVAEEATSLSLLNKGVDIIPITAKDYAAPAQRPAFSALDSSRTIAITGITPRHWRSNLRDVLQTIAAN